MERYRATEQLIAWAKSDETLVTDSLREAFEAFYKAGGVYNRMDEQGILEWRRILSGRIVIDSIHALTKTQLIKAEKGAQQIADDFKPKKQKQGNDI